MLKRVPLKKLIKDNMKQNKFKKIFIKGGKLSAVKKS